LPRCGFSFAVVRQDDPAHRLLLLFEDLDDEAVAERLQIHKSLPELGGRPAKGGPSLLHESGLDSSAGYA
jgi:hypothetical protein